MRWLEVSVHADGEAAEAVSEVFNRFGHGGAVIEQILLSDEAATAAAVETEDPVLMVRTFLPIDEHQGVVRRQLEEALWHLGQIYPIPAPEFREVADEDWIEAWKAGYGLQRVGQRIVIVPSWENYTPRPEEIVIRMEPGMAFGTGTHPTTRMCLVELERRVRPAMAVLDVGTGSGILAIAAARLGATPVLAVDIDSTAVEVARANLAANGVNVAVSVRQGSLEVLDSESRAWDLVVANILAEPIAAMADDLASALAPQGCLIAAGIISDEEPLVAGRFRAAGLAVSDRRQHHDWITLVATRSRLVV